jgi:hypothetical protein
MLGNFGNDPAPAAAVDAVQVRDWLEVVEQSTFDAFVALVGSEFSAVDSALSARVLTTDARLSDARPPLPHTHGNISNAGEIGSSPNLPLITAAGGVITTGSFGTAPNTFCEGSDSRLSNSREWTASTIDQAEAEAGTATTRRAWTAQRVRQAITSWWSTVTDAVKSFNTTITGGTNHFAVTAPATDENYAQFSFQSHSGPAGDEFGRVAIHANPEEGVILDARSNGAPEIYSITVHPTGYYVTQPAAFRAAIGVAQESHTHGNISNIGAIGSTADLLIGTGDSGLLETKTASQSRTAIGLNTGIIQLDLDGDGSVLPVGVLIGQLRVPYNCTITGWEIAANESGSIVIDIWKDTFANFPPTNGDSITASAKPTLTASQTASSTTLTGWVTSLNAGDYLRVEIESVAAITNATLILTVART